MTCECTDYNHHMYIAGVSLKMWMEHDGTNHEHWVEKSSKHVSVDYNDNNVV